MPPVICKSQIIILGETFDSQAILVTTLCGGGGGMRTCFSYILYLGISRCANIDVFFYYYFLLYFSIFSFLIKFYIYYISGIFSL